MTGADFPIFMVWIDRIDRSRALGSHASLPNSYCSSFDDGGSGSGLLDIQVCLRRRNVGG